MNQINYFQNVNIKLSITQNVENKIIFSHKKRKKKKNPKLTPKLPIGHSLSTICCPLYLRLYFLLGIFVNFHLFRVLKAFTLISPI